MTCWRTYDMAADYVENIEPDADPGAPCEHAHIHHCRCFVHPVTITSCLSCSLRTKQLQCWSKGIKAGGTVWQQEYLDVRDTFVFETTQQTRELLG